MYIKSVCRSGFNELVETRIHCYSLEPKKRPLEIEVFLCFRHDENLQEYLKMRQSTTGLIISRTVIRTQNIN